MKHKWRRYRRLIFNIMDMHYIPKFVDSQPKILIWDLDEGLILFVGFMLGILLGARTVFMPAAIIAWLIYARIKAKGQQGVFYHKMYAFGVSKIPKQLKMRIPAYWIKEFIP